MMLFFVAKKKKKRKKNQNSCQICLAFVAKKFEEIFYASLFLCILSFSLSLFLFIFRTRGAEKKEHTCILHTHIYKLTQTDSLSSSSNAVVVALRRTATKTRFIRRRRVIIYDLLLKTRLSSSSIRSWSGVVCWISPLFSCDK